MTPQEVIRVLSILTLASNIGVGLFCLMLIAQRIGFFKKEFAKVKKYFARKATKFSFLVSLIAVLGSLYLSEIAHFEPCKLCWYQRILMYPLPFILGISMYKKLKDVWHYVLPLSILGFVIAVYHYYFQMTGNPLMPCSSVGFSVSCSQRFFTHFGYITIPFMSLSAFASVVVGMLLAKANSKK